MIRNPIDIASRVSANLSALIEDRVNKSELEQDITLAIIRDFVAELLSDAFTETEERHHFDINESLLDELNALIEEFGESALAIDFVQENASEPLSRVIDVVVNDRDQENPPTLETVKDAMISGLLASLVGAGVLDEDEDDVLLAEEFIRYE